MNTHDTSSIKGVLAAGTVAQDFTLHVTPDQTLSLGELRGKPVILAFFPADWSPVRGQPDLEASLEAGTRSERVRADFSGGVRSGVNGTPTFYINGIRHEASFDFETLSAALQHAIEVAKM